MCIPSIFTLWRSVWTIRVKFRTNFALTHVSYVLLFTGCMLDDNIIPVRVNLSTVDVILWGFFLLGAGGVSKS